jgi:hypothetical protein
MTDVVNSTVPPLRPGDVTNFETLKTAHDNDALALMSAIRKSDNLPVALVCAMGRAENGDYCPTPLAVMVEGNPYELFQDPTTDTPPERLQPPKEYVAPEKRDMYMRYLGVLALLGECSVHVDEDIRSSIERAMTDACAAHPLKWKRILDRCVVEPDDQA